MSFSEAAQVFQPAAHYPYRIISLSYQSQKIFIKGKVNYDSVFFNEKYFSNHHIVSAACFPIFHLNHCCGVLYAEDVGFKYVSETQIYELDSFLTLVGILIENKFLNEAKLNLIQTLESKVKEQVAAIQKKEIEKHQAQILAQKAAEQMAYAALTRGIAHEVRNPLAMILSGVELIQDNLGNDAVVLEYADAIKESILRLKNVTSTMMRYGKPSLAQKQQANINELLQQVVLLAEFQCRSSKIELITSFSSVPHLTIDVNAMSQVFMNLILNSIEAIGDKGIVQISSHIEQNQNVDYVRVVFYDSGHGIKSSYLPRIFEPFFSSKHGNTGLGMPMVLKTIDAHSGYIDVVSEEGAYTSFSLLLPVEA